RSDSTGLRVVLRGPSLLSFWIFELPFGVLESVVTWEPVWDDAGSWKKRDYSLWLGIAPRADYVVLGGIFGTNSGYAPPDVQQGQRIRAVRRDVFSVTLIALGINSGAARKKNNPTKQVVVQAEVRADPGPSPRIRFRTR
ncbi:hypothetical protein B0H11DRAFT_2194366, partial [Mycena galericulata]